ncbi:hypothetical protein PPL_04174 [Heterostelium album PN500]|uniref:WAP domain-containing protein n=1 Tax=Heterostelium pallidum (strain ATCC 26659 / Pp 5 / PN500) TaxID=670386 RepID=D3B683_HETP5|nr:hypothetical protein PPL_04174 [Heterostelium album PN500]EFA83381.1 hypothetical protein PPL_04174 [Heterostelium album PN500]|eukprot:XP_020435498.1 hypothetical protein PPL_04174 [Heterostelium album PN500]
MYIQDFEEFYDKAETLFRSDPKHCLTRNNHSITYIYLISFSKTLSRQDILSNLDIIIMNKLIFLIVIISMLTYIGNCESNQQMELSCPPTKDHSTTCSNECGNGCPHGQLCCSNGCGQVCMAGVPKKPRKGVLNKE